MQRKRMPLAKTTLKRLVSEFPTHLWSDREMEEILSPQYGLVTGLEAMLADVDKLIAIDLDDIAPADPLSLGRE
jgi:hypothetical protein